MRYVWDLFVRVFHWSLVGAFSVAYFTHASLWDRMTHVQAGYVAGGLIVARIIWGFIAKGYANFQTFPPRPVRAAKYMVRVLNGNAKHYVGHNPTGSIVIYLMLTVGLLTVVSGVFTYNEGFDLLNVNLCQRIHAFFSWSWVGLVGMHVSGVIFESIMHRENLILAMITGFKRVPSVAARLAKQ